MLRCRLHAALLSLALLGLGGAASYSTVSAATAPAGEVAIRASLDSLNSVCARRDTSAFMALFDDGDDILLVGSSKDEVFHGRKAVARFRNILFGMPFAFGFDLAEVIIHREGHIAWAYVDGNMLHAHADGTVSRRPYRFSVAMIQRGRVWKMQMFHGSVPGGE